MSAGAGTMARRRLPAVLLVLLLLVGTAAAPLLPHAPESLHRVLGAVRALGVAGSLAFVALQIAVAVSGVLPASLLGMAAGALYGPVAGFALAALSTLAGAWIAFALARSALRPAVARMLRRRGTLAAFDDRVAREGWRLVALLRVSPVMPFALTSYALGLSSVAARDYVLGTLACLPALLGYVMVGAMAGTDLDSAGTDGQNVRRLLLLAGGAATLALIMRLGRLVAADGRG